MGDVANVSRRRFFVPFGVWVSVVELEEPGGEVKALAVVAWILCPEISYAKVTPQTKRGPKITPYAFT